ncbi:MAG TPA: hypothetical protein VH796_19185, partial [Nitrososphaeraceae archaeon]
FLDIEMIGILGVYSDPKRDPRGHIMSTVFIGHSLSNDKSKNKAAAQASFPLFVKPCIQLKLIFQH